MIYVTHDQEEALALADRVVIMRDGEFRQIGSPWEIYKKPKTSFVAEFVGTSNFLTGRKTDGKIRFGEREFVVSGIDEMGDGEIHLALRPENIELVNITVPTEDCIPANIVKVTAEVINFLGAIVRITFTLEGEEMIVDLPEKEFEQMELKRGEQMDLYFPPDAFHVYKELFRKLI